IALEVPVVAIGLGLDQRGSLAASGAGNRFSGGFVDREEIETVDDHTGHLVRGGAGGDITDGAVVADRGRLGVAVVLADEDDWQLPDRGEVERLVEGALVGSAVA